MIYDSHFDLEVMEQQRRSWRCSRRVKKKIHVSDFWILSVFVKRTSTMSCEVFYFFPFFFFNNYTNWVGERICPVSLSKMLFISAGVFSRMQVC